MNAIPTHRGWSRVPGHLLTATQLRQLDHPRQPTDYPHALVETLDWRGKKTTVGLYDPTLCEPTGGSAAQLEAAAARRGRDRDCGDCGARSPLPLPVREGRALCSTCHHIAQLRRAQGRAAADRPIATERVRQLLAQSRLAVGQCDPVNPGPTPAGAARPDVALRVRAVDSDHTTLVDVLVDLTTPGARSKFRVPQAVPAAEAVPLVHAALVGRPLLAWSTSELALLRDVARHPTWDQYRSVLDPPHTAVMGLSLRWRGLADDRNDQVASIHPGTPGRLLSHLRRVAATSAPDQGPDTDNPDPESTPA